MERSPKLKLAASRHTVVTTTSIPARHSPSELPRWYIANAVQVWVDGRIEFGYNHIDYILTRGLAVVPGSDSPAVILAAYPWEPTGKMLSDHAIVTVAIRLEQFS